MLEVLISQFNDNTPAELVAVAFAIAYLLLAVREKIACWYAAFISTGIFTFLFFDVRLYMESALQVYYLLMAVYGWYQWKHGGTIDESLPISIWTIRQHLIALTLICVATLTSTYFLTRYTDAHLPLLDSFTTWGAVITTYMVAKKILENWVYWLVIDSASIYLYVDRAMYFTTLLFIAYVVIIFFGWASWLRSYRQNQIA
ncbi:MAG: nicotinamide riboside transporter PnuC [Pseudomonadales bacterium]